MKESQTEAVSMIDGYFIEGKHLGRVGKLISYPVQNIVPCPNIVPNYRC